MILKKVMQDHFNQVLSFLINCILLFSPPDFLFFSHSALLFICLWHPESSYRYEILCYNVVMVQEILIPIYSHPHPYYYQMGVLTKRCGFVCPKQIFPQ